MEREIFAAHFRRAARDARTFAQSCVEEQLPEALRFLFSINRTSLEKGVSEEPLDLEDCGTAFFKLSEHCDEEAAIGMLWRDGAVPEWVNMGVVSETGEATLIEVMASSFFTRREDFLYGDHPFQIAGPSVPVNYQDGDRFSLHHRAVCTTREDLAYLRAHARTLQSLQLLGPLVDDEMLAQLPELPRLDFLELGRTALLGGGLHEVSRFPVLHTLRICADDGVSLCLPSRSGPFPSVKHLQLLRVPARRDFGMGGWLRLFPHLEALTLTSDDELRLEGRCPPSVEMLDLRGRRLTGSLELPEALDWLVLQRLEMRDAELSGWLAPLRQVRRLCLLDLSIGDALVEVLPARLGLEVLELSNTSVSPAALERVKAAHPELKFGL